MKMKKILFSSISSIYVSSCSCLWEKGSTYWRCYAQQQGATTEATQNYHIGIVTTSVSQSEDNFRGAEAVAKKIMV